MLVLTTLRAHVPGVKLPHLIQFSASAVFLFQPFCFLFCRPTCGCCHGNYHCEAVQFCGLGSCSSVLAVQTQTQALTAVEALMRGKDCNLWVQVEDSKKVLSE